MQIPDWNFFSGEFGLLLLKGFGCTIALAACAGILAISIGLVTSILAWLKVPVLSRLIKIYINVIRNTPFVVQLFLVYFSLPLLFPTDMLRFLQGIGFEFCVAALALGFYHGAYFCETFRSALQNVPDGQLSGARALGMPILYCLFRIVLPQAVRKALPALVGELIGLAKNTSISITIGVTELVYQYEYISNFYFRGTEALAVATVLYVLLSLSISGLGSIFSRSRPTKTA